MSRKSEGNGFFFVKDLPATAELARRVLQFLFRARHDQGLRSES